MKDWAATHPKAKLMARKRVAILDAAKKAFLQDGYDGVSMESIAADAGVSIMTLYRHADSKNDLFTAVITGICDFSEEARDAQFAEAMSQPLGQVLINVGVMFQEKMSDEETIALMRAVIPESTRFPQLAETAYQSFVGEYKDNLEKYLTMRPEASALDPAHRGQLCASFIEDLVGVSILRSQQKNISSARRQQPPNCSPNSRLSIPIDLGRRQQAYSGRMPSKAFCRSRLISPRCAKPASRGFQ